MAEAKAVEKNKLGVFAAFYFLFLFFNATLQIGRHSAPVCVSLILGSYEYIGNYVIAQTDLQSI